LRLSFCGRKVRKIRSFTVFPNAISVLQVKLKVGHVLIHWFWREHNTLSVTDGFAASGAVIGELYTMSGTRHINFQSASLLHLDAASFRNRAAREQLGEPGHVTPVPWFGAVRPSAPNCPRQGRAFFVFRPRMYGSAAGIESDFLRRTGLCIFCGVVGVCCGVSA
jgi:hypothetical protein